MNLRSARRLLETRKSLCESSRDVGIVSRMICRIIRRCSSEPVASDFTGEPG